MSPELGGLRPEYGWYRFEDLQCATVVRALCCGDGLSDCCCDGVANFLTVRLQVLQCRLELLQPLCVERHLLALQFGFSQIVPQVLQVLADLLDGRLGLLVEFFTPRLLVKTAFGAKPFPDADLTAALILQTRFTQGIAAAPAAVATGRCADWLC